MLVGVRRGISRSYDRPAPRVKPKSNRRPRYCVCWLSIAQRWENIEVRGGSGKVCGSGLARRYLGHTNRSRGKEYRPVANFLLSKRIDLDRRTKSEGYVSKSPISCKLPLGARIISIANALDAMLSDCHYRRYAFPMSHAR